MSHSVDQPPLAWQFEASSGVWKPFHKHAAMELEAKYSRYMDTAAMPIQSPVHPPIHSVGLVTCFISHAWSNPWGLIVNSLLHSSTPHSLTRSMTTVSFIALHYFGKYFVRSLHTSSTRFTSSHNSDCHH